MVFDLEIPSIADEREKLFRGEREVILSLISIFPPLPSTAQ